VGDVDSSLSQKQDTCSSHNYMLLTKEYVSRICKSLEKRKFFKSRNLTHSGQWRHNGGKFFFVRTMKAYAVVEI